MTGGNIQRHSGGGNQLTGGHEVHPSKSHTRVSVSILRVCNKARCYGTKRGGGGAKILSQAKTVSDTDAGSEPATLMCFWFELPSEKPASSLFKQALCVQFGVELGRKHKGNSLSKCLDRVTC